MKLRNWIASILLVAAVVGAGFFLAQWKVASIQAAIAAGANQPEPSESITVATASPREHRRVTVSIGTVLALRSIMLRNENAGTVRKVDLFPGQVVEAGRVLVQLDVAVEEAELKALEAQETLAETALERALSLRRNQSGSQEELDRARSIRDVARAQIARTKAVIDRKTIRAPFKARVGMVDVHPGQYLGEGDSLTTLQGVDPAVHVDFAVNQHVAAGLKVGERVEILATAISPAAAAHVVAVDAKVDQATRNAMVRVRIDEAPKSLSPGASVRVRVPVGPPEPLLAVPASALRKGASGDHVFVVEADKEGKKRARQRPVIAGSLVGDDVFIYSGLKAGEQVAASGAFKLREGIAVAVVEEPAAGVSTTAR